MLIVTSKFTAENNNELFYDYINKSTSPLRQIDFFQYFIKI